MGEDYGLWDRNCQRFSRHLFKCIYTPLDIQQVFKGIRAVPRAHAKQTLMRRAREYNTGEARLVVGSDGIHSMSGSFENILFECECALLLFASILAIYEYGRYGRSWPFVLMFSFVVTLLMKMNIDVFAALSPRNFRLGLSTPEKLQLIINMILRTDQQQEWSISQIEKDLSSSGATTASVLLNDDTDGQRLRRLVDENLPAEEIIYDMSSQNIPPSEPRMIAQDSQDVVSLQDHGMERNHTLHSS